MLGLRELQAAFAAALEGEEAAAELLAQVHARGLEPARRVAVYRNSTRLTQAEGLAGIYPALERLLGEEFFAHMAELYGAAFPSRSGDLRGYGGDLAEFLQGFAPTASLGYLPEVARLEWAWHEAFHAPFAAALEAQALAKLPQEQRTDVKLRLRPGARLLRSAHAAARIWEFALSEHDENTPRLKLEEDAPPSHVLVVRPQLDVLVVELAPGEWRWLQALHAGEPLAVAEALARATQADADCGRYLDTHLALGSFAA